ncbi:MAG: hypothetical protein N3G77_07330 [Nitrososphaeria archaeon]|nr:hypothetical protein [Nitrososphaeria archaeon]
MSLLDVIVQIIVGFVVVAPILWVSGRMLVGKEKAKFTDALWIVFLGVVIGAIINYFLSGLIATIIIIIVWLALIRHFFDCGWLKALAIAIISTILFAIITIILAFLGIGALVTWF